MVSQIDSGAFDELRNTGPSDMVHDVMIATFMILGDESESAKVLINNKKALHIFSQRDISTGEYLGGGRGPGTSPYPRCRPSFPSFMRLQMHDVGKISLGPP